MCVCVYNTGNIRRVMQRVLVDRQTHYYVCVRESLWINEPVSKLVVSFKVEQTLHRENII